MKKIISILFTATLLFACNSSQQSSSNNKDKSNGVKIMGEAQGTTYTIIYLENENNYQTQIDSILDRYDQDISLWVEGSLINRMNGHKRRDTVFAFFDTTKYFSVLFDVSKDIYKKTNGAFDPSVNPLVEAWGFGLKHKEKITKELIDSLLEKVGFDDLSIDMNEFYKNRYYYEKTEIFKGNPQVTLNFNAIAQGHSIDIVSEFLTTKGIENYMVEIGGELFCKGKNQHDKPWEIAIDKPVDNGTENSYQTVIQVSNQAVATSGNYRHFYELDGKKYAHTINPKTGYPVDHSLLSVTVITTDCSTADAYATAFMVMGVEESLLFVEKNPSLKLDIYMVYDNKGKLGIAMNEGMKKYISQ